LSLANELVIKNAGSRDAQTFIEVVTKRLSANGVSSDELDWNANRRDDGRWVIRLSYPNRDGRGDAVWFFDVAKRLIISEDEGASWIMGETPVTTSNRNSEPEINHGLVYSNQTPTVQINTAPTPRLSVIRENEDAEDGVKKRASVPSWDEIMFGTKKNESDDQ
jgi:hypothetical protein